MGLIVFCMLLHCRLFCRRHRGTGCPCWAAPVELKGDASRYCCTPDGQWCSMSPWGVLPDAQVFYGCPKSPQDAEAFTCKSVSVKKPASRHLCHGTCFTSVSVYITDSNSSKVPVLLSAARACKPHRIRTNNAGRYGGSRAQQGAAKKTARCDCHLVRCLPVSACLGCGAKRWSLFEAKNLYQQTLKVSFI